MCPEHVSTQLVPSVLLNTCTAVLCCFLVGVSYDPTQRKLGSTTKREGLHFGAPGFRFIKFSSLFQTVSYTKVSCLNKDGLVINLDVQFQYRVDANDLRDVILEFKNADNYEDIVRYITNYLRNIDLKLINNS